MEGNGNQSGNGNRENELLLQAVLQMSEDLARLEKRMNQEHRKLHEEIKKQNEETFGRLLPQQEKQAQELNRLMDGTSRRQVELSNLLEHIQRGYTGLYTMWNQKVSEADQEMRNLKVLKEELRQYVSNLTGVRWEWLVTVIAAVVLSSMVSTWMVGREVSGYTKIEQTELARLRAIEQEAARTRSWCESLSADENERARSCLMTPPAESQPASETPKKSEKKSGSEKRKR